MSERHVELWGRTIGSREEFDPEGGLPIGLHIIEAMRGHTLTKAGRQNISKDVLAKVVARKLKLFWNNKGYDTIKEDCIVTKVLKFYKEYLKLDGKNLEDRSEAWKEKQVRPFKDKLFEPFKISSRAGSSLDTTFGRELVHIKVPL